MESNAQRGHCFELSSSFEESIHRYISHFSYCTIASRNCGCRVLQIDKSAALRVVAEQYQTLRNELQVKKEKDCQFTYHFFFFS